jgi:Plasmid pRiA4b ORF-3-like protein
MIMPIDNRAGASLYQLKITLLYVEPVVWRRVVVCSDMTLDRMDRVIQTAMGWTNSHLHQFRVGRTYYKIIDPEFDDDKTLPEKRYTVRDLAPSVKSKFFYEYDFGDNWEHEVLLEKTLPMDPNFKHPVCLDGANACPPEDCGGTTGYGEFLYAMAHPECEEHEQMKEWIGGEWDASRFDLGAVNASLKRFKA